MKYTLLITQQIYTYYDEFSSFGFVLLGNWNVSNFVIYMKLKGRCLFKPISLFGEFVSEICREKSIV